MKGTSKRKEAREQSIANLHNQSKKVATHKWCGYSSKKKDILCVDYGVLLGKKKNEIKK